MVRNWLLYLGALLGALVFHMYYPLWLSWFLLLIAAGLPLLSLLLSAPLWATAKVRLEGPPRLILGESASAQLRLTSLLPPGRCYAYLSQPGGKKGRKLSLRDSLSLPLDTSHCTRLELRIRRLRILDYLGLFFLPKARPEPLAVEIWPLPLAPEPMPDATALLSPPLRPKPGGGYAEIHELRDYRPGDPLRDVHWKLSAKADKLIVREAQEEIRQGIALALSLHGVGAEADSCLGQLLYLSRWLLVRGLSHGVLCTTGPNEVLRARIDSEEALEALMTRILTCLPEITPWQGPDTPEAAQGFWCYTIRPQGKEVRP